MISLFICRVVKDKKKILQEKEVWIQDVLCEKRKDKKEYSRG